MTQTKYENGSLSNTWDYYYNDANQLTSQYQTQYSPTTKIIESFYDYDKSGNLVQKQIDDPRDGIIDDTWEYDYDNYNRMTEVELNSNTVMNYTFNALGDRVMKKNGATELKMLYNAGDCIADYNENDVLQKYYITAMTDENMIVNESSSDYYFLQDGLGNVREIIDTSAPRVKKNIYDFEGFGSDIANGHTQVLTNRFMYTGREQDTESGLYYYRARMYDPTVGSFTGRDPVTVTNMYTYCSASPIIHADPLGLWKKVAGKENTYIAEGKTDSLESLAKEVGGMDCDWPCLWPVDIKDTAAYDNFADGSGGCWFSNKKFVSKGDCYSTENFSTTKGQSVKITVAKDLKEDHTKAFKTKYLSEDGDDIIKELAEVSKQGATPIWYFLITGHHGGGDIGGMDWHANDFSAKYLYSKRKTDYKPTYSRAKDKKGPPRCWFCKDALFRANGCHTKRLANQFANKILRKGATACGTKHYEAVWASGKIRMRDYENNDHINGKVTYEKFYKTVKDFYASSAFATFKGGCPKSGNADSGSAPEFDKRREKG